MLLRKTHKKTQQNILRQHNYLLKFSTLKNIYQLEHWKRTYGKDERILRKNCKKMQPQCTKIFVCMLAYDWNDQPLEWKFQESKDILILPVNAIPFRPLMTKVRRATGWQQLFHTLHEGNQKGDVTILLPIFLNYHLAPENGSRLFFLMLLNVCLSLWNWKSKNIYFDFGQENWKKITTTKKFLHPRLQNFIIILSMIVNNKKTNF